MPSCSGEMQRAPWNTTWQVAVTVWQVRSGSCSPSLDRSRHCTSGDFHPLCFIACGFSIPVRTSFALHTAVTHCRGQPSNNGWQELVCKDRSSPPSALGRDNSEVLVGPQLLKLQALPQGQLIHNTLLTGCLLLPSKLLLHPNSCLRTCL